MPYIIAVFVLVIVGVGYTFFQDKHTHIFTENMSVEEELIKPVANPTTTPALIPDGTGVPLETNTETELNNTTNPTPEIKPFSEDSTSAPVKSNNFNNGTYHTQKSYRTPDGTYQMDVTLTITNDIVTSANLSFDTRGSKSKYSKRFSSSYQSQVIGKNLNDIKLSRVSGASLTTATFNSAVMTIGNQAS